MACRAFGPHNGKGLRESIGIFCALMGFKELEKRSGRFEKKEMCIRDRYRTSGLSDMLGDEYFIHQPLQTFSKRFVFSAAHAEHGRIGIPPMDGDGTPKAAFHFQELLDKIQNSPVDFTDPCSVGPGFFETALAVPVSIPVKAFQASLRRAEQEFPIEVVILRRVVEFPKIAVFTLRIQIADQLPLEQEGFSCVGLRAIAGIGPGQNPGDVAAASPKAVYGVVKGNGPAACPAKDVYKRQAT